MKTVIIPKNELDKMFPIALKSLLSPEQFGKISVFELKAMSKGVTSEEINSIMKILS